MSTYMYVVTEKDYLQFFERYQESSLIRCYL